MSSIALIDLLSRAQDLPVLSPLVNELLASINQEDVDIDKVAKKISSDQALTIKALRLANSSFYGMQHKVASIQEAIAILGFRNIKTLVTTSSITSSFQIKNAKHFDVQAFWQHSIAAAVCARELAIHCKANPDVAFIAGLLHDIGILVLVTRYPALYEETREYQIAHHCSELDAEIAVLGITHCYIGKTVAKHWNFPEEIQDAVEFHHPASLASVGKLAAIVHLASTFSLALDLSHEDDAAVPPISDLAWNLLEMNEAICLDIFAKTEQQFAEICEILIS